MKAEGPLTEGSLPEEITIRRYLLGQLDASPELVEKLDDRMLSDAAFSELVGAIEDEIIEEYLDGTLDSLDRQAVEKHFLRPPERQQKLRLARRLNKHLAADSDVLAGPEQSVSLALWRSHWRTLMEVAAGVAIAMASALYIVSLRQDFQAEIGKNQHELAQEHEHSTQLARQLEEVRNSRRSPTVVRNGRIDYPMTPASVFTFRQPSIVLLSLLQPGRLRAGVPIPDVDLGPVTQQIHMEVRLPDTSAGPCDVRLALADIAAVTAILWSKNHIQPLKSPEMALLVFDLPTNGIKPAKYELLVRQHPGDNYEISYSFEVKAPSQ